MENDLKALKFEFNLEYLQKLYSFKSALKKQKLDIWTKLQEQAEKLHIYREPIIRWDKEYMNRKRYYICSPCFSHLFCVPCVFFAKKFRNVPLSNKGYEISNYKTTEKHIIKHEQSASHEKACQFYDECTEEELQLERSFSEISFEPDDIAKNRHIADCVISCIMHCVTSGWYN